EYIDEEDLFKIFHDPAKTDVFDDEEEEEEVNDCQSTTTKRRRMSTNEQEIINSNHYDGSRQNNSNQLLCMQPHHMDVVPNLFPSQASMMYNQQQLDQPNQMGFFPTLPPSLAPVTPMMYQLTEPNLGTQVPTMLLRQPFRGRGEDRTLKVGSTLLISETRAPFGRVVGYYFGFGYVRRPFYVVRMESDIKTPRGTLIPLVVQKIAEYIDEEDLFKRFNDPVRAAFDIFEEEEEEVNDCQSTTTKRRRMSSEEEIINSNKKILRTCNHYEGQCQDNFNQLLCMQPHHINQPNQMGFVSNLLPSQAPINQPNNMGVVPNPFPFQAPMMYNQQYGTPVMYNQQSMGPVTNQQNQMSSMRMFNAAGQSSYRGRGSHRSRARGLGRGGRD
ncbi:unnamed protein product, partial [Brassica oleracea var. botrytis]